jgi:large subunit ribosomal protein L31
MELLYKIAENSHLLVFKMGTRYEIRLDKGLLSLSFRGILGYNLPPEIWRQKIMKTEIHPDYQECEVRCGCGNTFTTRSTKKSIQVEICSSCHPFYTGTQKFVDTAGRVEKFNKRFARTKEMQSSVQPKKKKKSF